MTTHHAGGLLLMLEVAHTLALVLKGAGRKREVLPPAVFAILRAIRFIRVERAVDVGVVDQDRLSACWAVVAHEEYIRYHLSAELYLSCCPGFVERTAELSGIDKAGWRKQVARIRPHVRSTAGVIRWRPDVHENGLIWESC